MQDSSSGLNWDMAVNRCGEWLTTIGIPVKESHFLLAVSGGMDSLCMLFLFDAMQLRFDVAHVNYGLRGKESDADAALVREICARMGITLHARSIDLKSIAESGNESLQQTGRRLRYHWFEQLRQTHHYHYVCTAHHQDDTAETFFVNLIRGTGLKGLTGIPALREGILRPLLCFTREEISHLVREQHIVYRDDASNFGKDYLRNRIRHDIIPLFKAERASFITRMYSTQQRLREEYALLEDFLRKLKDDICKEGQGQVAIDLAKLLSCTSPAIVLHFILKDYGFSWSQCRAIITLPHESGAKFVSPAYELIFDRQQIRVHQYSAPAGDDMIPLNQEGRYLLRDGELTLRYLNAIPLFSNDPQTEFIDAEKITGELHIRHWREGDFFYPLGMQGRQKLQDFFTNQKIAVHDKSNIWIVTSGNDIMWIAGMRLDDRFKITSTTKQVICLEWKPADD